MKIKPATQKGAVLVEVKSGEDILLKPPSFQIQRILVPVDFSEMATKAIQYANPLATLLGAEVVLVHVVPPTYTLPPELGYLPPEMAASQQELVDSTRECLNKLCSREIGPGVRSEVKVRLGVAWQEIVCEAEESKADLIILSTHGRTGLKHALLGSVTERVVRHAACPVLVVRERERDFVPIR